MTLIGFFMKQEGTELYEVFTDAPIFYKKVRRHFTTGSWEYYYDTRWFRVVSVGDNLLLDKEYSKFMKGTKATYKYERETDPEKADNSRWENVHRL